VKCASSISNGTRNSSLFLEGCKQGGSFEEFIPGIGHDLSVLPPF
jgi:hypothetical protein